MIFMLPKLEPMNRWLCLFNFCSAMLKIELQSAVDFQTPLPYFLLIKSSVFFVSSWYTLIKCDLNIADFGDSDPALKITIDWDSLAGMWQSIQFCFSWSAGNPFSEQNFSWPLLWQDIQRCENSALFPLSLSCGLWQVLQVMVSDWRKHLLAFNNPNWLPCASTVPKFTLAWLSVSDIKKCESVSPGL